MILDLDEHLGLIEAKGKLRLSVAESSDLLVLLRREPMVTLQKQVLLNINGQLNALASLDLTKQNGLLDAARIQGVILGLRLFFDIVAELLAAAEPEGGLI